MNYVNPVNKPLCLQVLYEDNYLKLLKSLPFLRNPEAQFPPTSKNIHAQLLERCPYTLTIKLQSLGEQQKPIGPIITCRLYLDTRSAEVLHVDGFMPKLNKFHHDSPRTVLDKKWVLNYFLEQWLVFNSHSSEQAKTFADMANA